MAVKTVSGFSGPPTASQTFGTLRLADPDSSTRQRRQRRKSRSPPPRAALRTPDSETSTLKPEESSIARVTGYDPYAMTAIRTASKDGVDVLALSWTGCDSVMALMKRIEDLVCIPLMYWRLACHGEVLDPAASTITHPHFLKDAVVDLVLVPLGTLDQFVDEQQPATSPSSAGPAGAAPPSESARFVGAPAHWSSSLVLVEDPREGSSAIWSRAGH